MFIQAPLPSIPTHLSYEMWNASAQIENGFQEVSAVVSEVTMILYVKDHTCKGKEPFHVKTKESNCADFMVGHFN